MTDDLKHGPTKRGRGRLPLGQSETRTCGVCLPETDWREWKVAAARDGLSLSAWVRQIVSAHLASAKAAQGDQPQ